jgi:hypothetical protein
MQPSNATRARPQSRAVGAPLPSPTSPPESARGQRQQTPLRWTLPRESTNPSAAPSAALARRWTRSGSPAHGQSGQAPSATGAAQGGRAGQPDGWAWLWLFDQPEFLTAASCWPGDLVCDCLDGLIEARNEEDLFGTQRGGHLGLLHPIDRQMTSPRSSSMPLALFSAVTCPKIWQSSSAAPESSLRT